MQEKYLTNEELFVELKNRAGLIPVEIVSDNGQIIWLDFETYHSYEGFFYKSLETFSTLKQLQNREAVYFKTDFEILSDENILTDYIYPTAFIFHTGRAGSTLLAKILAHSRENMVFSEANPHNQLRIIIGNKSNEENKKIYKHLILAMGRKRLTTHQNHFIKFTSYNILFYDFIRSVFPDVPAIFLYREPARILKSFNRTMPAWFGLNDETKALITGISAEQISGMNQFEFSAKVLSDFFSAALLRAGEGLMFLNYKHLTADNLPKILEALNTKTTKEEFDRMKSQFGYDSKTENSLKEFSSTASDKSTGLELEDSVLSELSKLYAELSHSTRNLFF